MKKENKEIPLDIERMKAMTGLSEQTLKAMEIVCHQYLVNQDINQFIEDFGTIIAQLHGANSK